jgi:hypothetical protein
MGTDTARTATATTTDTTSRPPSAPPPVLPVNNRGWETVQPGTKKTKIPIPKLITTKYPQSEREVTCHFQDSGSNCTDGIHSEKTYSERQTIAHAALRHGN